MGLQKEFGGRAPSEQRREQQEAAAAKKAGRRRRRRRKNGGASVQEKVVTFSKDKSHPFTEVVAASQSHDPAPQPRITSEEIPDDAIFAVGKEYGKGPWLKGEIPKEAWEPDAPFGSADNPSKRVSPPYRNTVGKIVPEMIQPDTPPIPKMADLVDESTEEIEDKMVEEIDAPSLGQEDESDTHGGPDRYEKMAAGVEDAPIPEGQYGSVSTPMPPSSHGVSEQGDVVLPENEAGSIALSQSEVYEYQDEGPKHMGHKRQAYLTKGMGLTKNDRPRARKSGVKTSRKERNERTKYRRRYREDLVRTGDEPYRKPPAARVQPRELTPEEKAATAVILKADKQMRIGKPRTEGEQGG
jgi:hypothetical protein